jgi:hypothetical protein
MCSIKYVIDWLDSQQRPMAAKLSRLAITMARPRPLTKHKLHRLCHPGRAQGQRSHLFRNEIWQVAPAIIISL